MSSTRHKLILDEQSFQGLLAAAFTIQQHNDRQRALGLNSAHAEEFASLPATDVCKHCGVPIPAGQTACLKCTTENFRPGERLQRNWASMWMMSQEKSLAANVEPDDPVRFEGDGDPLRSRPDGGERDAEKFASLPHFGGGTFLDAARPDPSKTEAPPAKDPAPIDGRRNPVGNAVSSVFWRKNDLPADDQTVEDIAGTDLALQSLASDEIQSQDFHFDISPGPDSSADDSLSRGSSSKTNAIRRGLLDLRVKLRFHRADLYLGVALVVAFLALLWPATASQRPKLHPWERMLIAMGIAEAPAPSVHYPGSPNIKVWVDTHTALYYCPGDELYGKSQDGHYSTQHEAQLDRFEPAERVACVE
jgi:ribosomal protein L40E